MRITELIQRSIARVVKRLCRIDGRGNIFLNICAYCGGFCLLGFFLFGVFVCVCVFCFSQSQVEVVWMKHIGGSSLHRMEKLLNPKIPLQPGIASC